MADRFTTTARDAAVEATAIDDSLRQASTHADRAARATRPISSQSNRGVDPWRD